VVRNGSSYNSQNIEDKTVALLKKEDVVNGIRGLLTTGRIVNESLVYVDLRVRGIEPEETDKNYKEYFNRCMAIVTAQRREKIDKVDSLSPKELVDFVIGFISETSLGKILNEYIGEGGSWFDKFINDYFHGMDVYDVAMNLATGE
jgi:hypothetical protein